MDSIVNVPATKVYPNFRCDLCKGILIDATALPGCPHTFCKTCLVSYLHRQRSGPYNCPSAGCGERIHESRPFDYIRNDSTLQSLLFKLMPNVYSEEMTRRRKFYNDNPDLRVGVATSEELGDPMSIAGLPPATPKIVTVQLTFDEILAPLVESDAVPKSGSKICFTVSSDLTIDRLKECVQLKYHLKDPQMVVLMFSTTLLQDHLSLAYVMHFFGSGEGKADLNLTYIFFGVDGFPDNLAREAAVIRLIRKRPFENLMMHASRICRSQQQQPPQQSVQSESPQETAQTESSSPSTSSPPNFVPVHQTLVKFPANLVNGMLPPRLPLVLPPGITLPPLPVPSVSQTVEPAPFDQRAMMNAIEKLTGRILEPEEEKELLSRLKARSLNSDVNGAPMFQHFVLPGKFVGPPLHDQVVFDPQAEEKLNNLLKKRPLQPMMISNSQYVLPPRNAPSAPRPPGPSFYEMNRTLMDHNYAKDPRMEPNFGTPCLTPRARAVLEAAGRIAIVTCPAAPKTNGTNPPPKIHIVMTPGVQQPRKLQTMTTRKRKLSKIGDSNIGVTDGSAVKILPRPIAPKPAGGQTQNGNGPMIITAPHLRMIRPTPLVVPTQTAETEKKTEETPVVESPVLSSVCEVTAATASDSGISESSVMKVDSRNNEKNAESDRVPNGVESMECNQNDRSVPAEDACSSNGSD